MKTLDMVRSPEGGWLVTLFCSACQRSTTIDDSDMPGGRTGWLTFLATVRGEGWLEQPNDGSPYPDYLCPTCRPAPPPTARPQLDLFA